MRKWAFESKTTTDAQTLDIERVANARLRSLNRGSVACFRDPDGFGLIYTYNGLNKEMRERQLQETGVLSGRSVNMDLLMDGLELLRQRMMNAALPHGWVDNPDEADALELE